MTLIDLPKPNGKTVQEKYEYAKFLMLCNEPTLDVLKFFEREKDNITFKSTISVYSTKYTLVWEKGELFETILKTIEDHGYIGFGSEPAISVHHYSFEWANSYEQSLLHTAVDELINLSRERSNQQARQEAKAKNDAERNALKKWLDTHEES